MAIEKDQNIAESIKAVQFSKKKAYGFTVFTVVVVIILVVFAVRPSVAAILRVRNEIKVKKAYQEQLNNKINALGSLYSQYVEFEGSVNKIKLIYPHTGDFSLFMTNIEGLAKKNNYELVSISFSEPSIDSSISTSVLTTWGTNITVVGSEKDIILFMKDIEAMPMYPIIDRVNYSTEKDENDKITVSMGITIYKIDDPLFYE